MALFNYLAKSEDGQLKNGTIKAENRNEAGTLLKAQMLNPISISAKQGIFVTLGKPKLSLKEMYLFTQQFALMVTTGLPIRDTLVTLLEETENKKIKTVLGTINKKVEDGMTLSDAFTESGAFPNYYISLIKSGESSGKLSEILDKLAVNIQHNYEFRSRLRGALILPGIILLLMLAVVMLIMIYAIPNLTKMFTSSKIELPITTKILMATSKFASSYWWLIILILIFAVVSVTLYSKSKSGRINIDRFILRLPILGTLVKKLTLARISSTFTTLLAAGMPMLDIIDITAEVADNKIYQKILLEAHTKLENGLSLAEAMENRQYIPPLVIHMLKIGEKTGKLEYSLSKITDFYDTESQEMLKNFSVLIEPVLTIVMGVGVAFIMLSVVDPIYKLVRTL